MNKLFSQIHIYCYIFLFMYQVYTINAVDVMCTIVPLSTAEVNAETDSIKVEFRESRDDFMPKNNSELQSLDFTINQTYFTKFSKFEQKLRDGLKTFGIKRTNLLGVRNQYK